eukprot:gb/GFBE01024251.1/.p1 GENE.gb/GFBE01024251.1/~~gb/GFBE01024251.1/.p1  ORF type:complete len:192 (+),score=30.47 gb/GFBE01024251.1/:1-576(+)
MGPSKSAKVQVINGMGQHARRIQVAHIYRQEIGANFYHHHVWTDVENEGCTRTTLAVELEAGLGDWTNHDYWFVQAELDDGSIWSCCPPAAPEHVTEVHGKQPYLEEKGGGIVNITISQGVDGLKIDGLHSSHPSADFLRSGTWVSDPHDGWYSCPNWFRITPTGAECTAGLKGSGDLSAPPKVASTAGGA